jgi:hypothetical protein
MIQTTESDGECRVPSPSEAQKLPPQHWLAQLLWEPWTWTHPVGPLLCFLLLTTSKAWSIWASWPVMFDILPKWDGERDELWIRGSQTSSPCCSVK